MWRARIVILPGSCTSAIYLELQYLFFRDFSSEKSSSTSKLRAKRKFEPKIPVGGLKSQSPKQKSSKSCSKIIKNQLCIFCKFHLFILSNWVLECFMMIWKCFYCGVKVFTDSIRLSKLKRCEFINRPPPIEVTEPGPLGSFCEGITHWEQWASHTPKLYKPKSCRPSMKWKFSYTAPKG